MNACEALTDAALAVLVQQNDADAFVELSARYIGFIRSKAASFHLFAMEVDDLWQEGLLGLYHAATTFQPERGAGFQTYAGICISNQIVSAYRTQCSQKHQILNDSLSLQDASFPQEVWLAADGDGMDPAIQIIAQESVQAVNAHLSRSLSSLEKEVLRLYLNGYSYREIAQVLHLSEKGADNAIQRIRKKLKKLLA